jgi:hypothetical protein
VQGRRLGPGGTFQRGLEAGLASRSRMLARGAIWSFLPFAAACPGREAADALLGRTAVTVSAPCTEPRRSSASIARLRLWLLAAFGAHWRGVARLDGASWRPGCAGSQPSLGPSLPLWGGRATEPPVAAPIPPTSFSEGALGATNIRSPPVDGAHESRPWGQGWRVTKPPKQNAAAPERGPACSGREPHSGEPRPTNRRSLLSMIQRENVLGSTR